jgi:two-component system chemotaxis sensor kinase CheA
MRVSFRAKLMTIVGSAALAFVVILTVSAVTASRVDAQLTAIQDRHLPKIDLEARLDAQFDRLQRSFQDAVAAHDIDALERTRSIEDALLAQLDGARQVVTPADLDALRVAIEDYYAAAHGVSRRIIDGETGEALVDRMAVMQAKQARTRVLLKETTRFNRAELTEAFAAAKRAQVAASELRLGVVIACLAFVVFLSLWLSRGTIASLDSLATGLARFGKGDFDKSIEVTTSDELGDLAGHANAMAKSLERVHGERERTAWLKTGQASLAEELRGELEPEEVARRATALVARHIDAPAAAVYVLASDGSFRLFGRHAYAAGDAASDAAPSFRPEEGLVGQASMIHDITVVTDPPAGYLRVRSGLGEAPPTAIVLLPLVHEGRVTGVMEFALFKPWSERAAELLVSVRESIAIAIEVARARSAMRTLLAETQEQAVRLSTQEEQLRATNEELEVQQEELRHTNDALTLQTAILETQRRGLEAKNVEVEDARRRLEEKASELTAVSAYKSQFLANMSHELRTPLNSMLLLSQLLAENETGNLTAKQVEFAKTVHGAGNDLLALINEVLDLAKVEAGKQQLRVEVVPLRDIADRARRAFEPLASRKGLALVVDVAPGLPEEIATDRQRLTQILDNLLANAIKFTEHGEVALRFGTSQAGTRLAIAVADTGVGIAPEHRERVFAPFEQVESSSDRRYGGTGLGLTIARELASLLGGELQLESVFGKGTTFTCYLPLDGPTQPSATRSATPASGVAASPLQRAESVARSVLVVDDPERFHASDERFAGKKVLLVDDDMRAVYALSAALRAKGLEVVVADDGRAALTALGAQPDVAAVLMDVMMPEMDGYEATRRIRAMARFRTLPIIALTAKAMKGDRAKCLESGASDYLEKPVDVARLLTMLYSWLTRPPIVRSDQP